MGLIRSLRRIGIAGGAPPPRTDFRRIGLEPPSVPTGPRETGEYLEIRPFAERLDAFVDLVRLPAVLATWRDDQFADTRRATVRVAAGREQAGLGICTRPKPEPGEEAAVVIEKL